MFVVTFLKVSNTEVFIFMSYNDMNYKDISISNHYFERVFELSEGGFKTISFSGQTNAGLIESGESSEGAVILGDTSYTLGGRAENALPYLRHELSYIDSKKTQRLTVTFGAGKGLPAELKVKLMFDAPDDIPVLIKQIQIDNDSDRSVRLDGLQVEAFTPICDGDEVLVLETDYVRDAMTIEGQRARSPYVENLEIYVNAMLNTEPRPTNFAYPKRLDRWIAPGQRFSSLRVFEFVMPNTSQALKGLAFRKATRKLFPWTCERYLCMGTIPALNIDDYYKAIDTAAEAGFEYINMHHGWRNHSPMMVSPLFTNYNDYELRPELFPNGWEDVRKLTDYAHDKGLKIGFYTISKETWRDDKGKEGAPRAHSENNWAQIWSKDDDSPRWGNTLDPGTDWGLFYNRQMEDAIVKGGFDTYHIDGPYYGDVNQVQGAGCRPGGPNQLLAWERNADFYGRMRALGIHGEAAAGWYAYAHGMSRITQTGYCEGDFGELTMYEQALAVRKGAYTFTTLFRPEQATGFIPVSAWSPAEDAPDMLPMEDHVEELDCYYGTLYGYGFEGKPFTPYAFDGPKSKAVICKWLDFWKKHADYFKLGYVLHLREPDGKNIDAIAHVIEGDHPRALVVAYNPTVKELSSEISLEPLSCAGLPLSAWRVRSEDGGEQVLEAGALSVQVAGHKATWFELALSTDK